MVCCAGRVQPCGFLSFLFSLPTSRAAAWSGTDALRWRVTHTYPGQICAAPSRAKSNKLRCAGHVQANIFRLEKGPAFLSLSPLFLHPSLRLSHFFAISCTKFQIVNH